MKIRYLLFVLTLLASSLFSKDIVTRFGFINNIEALSDFKYVKESLSKWIKKVGSTHIKTLSIHFYEEPEILYEDFKNGKLDIVGINPNTFFENEEKFSKYSLDYWSLSYTSQNNTKYCLISNTNEKLNNFKILENKSIVLKHAEEVSYDWINKNSLQYNKDSIETIAKKVNYTKKESTVVLNIFFEKYNLGVVKSSTLNTMMELNPKIKTKVKIVTCSKINLIPLIGFFHKNTHEKDNVELFFNLTSDFKHSEEKTFSLILNFNHIYKINKQNMDKLRTFYKEYEELLDKY